MEKIKFLPNKIIKLNGTKYKPYLIGDLPPSFGLLYIDSGEDVRPGISEWFNIKGLTYIKQ